MPNVDWTDPGTSGNWSSTTNWTGLLAGASYPGQTPVGDLVTIGASNSAFVVTFNVPSATISSLTVEGGNGTNHATILRMTAGDTLIIEGGVTLLKKDSNATIDGAGTISVSGGITALGGTPTEGIITAGTDTTGGVLELTGSGFVSSPFVFAIGTAAPSTLEFNLVGGVLASAAITINNVNQTLEIGPSGSLSIGATQNVTSGTILMAGGRLTDASGISLGNGTSNGSLGGFGTVTANLTRSGSGTADRITASGGTLDLTGTFGAGLVAAISAGSASTLKFDNAATSNAAISITSANQTLEIGSAGELTIGAAQNVTHGTIKLDGGTIIDLGIGGISFGTGASSGSLSGFGVVATDRLTRSGSGTADIITATGGKLTLFTTIGANSGLVFDIDNSPVSSLQLDIAPGTGNTFTFLGSAGNLALPGFEADNVSVAGLNVGGSAIIPTNFIDILGTKVTITSGQTGTGDSGIVTLSNGDTFNLTGITNASAPWHVLTKSDSAGGTDVFLSIVCFFAGTMIACPDGERAVETLSIGDLVLTSDGRVMPVRWIGRNTVSTKFADPLRVLPIRIRAGALADHLPVRDLLVSPEHAVLVDDILVQAGALVNGLSIVRESKVAETFVYYHIELAEHALVLADGTPAESFVDNIHRMAFDNWEEHEALYGDAPIVEMDYPRARSHRQVPMDIRARLLDRAASAPAVQKEIAA